MMVPQTATSCRSRPTCLHMLAFRKCVACCLLFARLLAHAFEILSAISLAWGFVFTNGSC